MRACECVCVFVRAALPLGGRDDGRDGGRDGRDGVGGAGSSSMGAHPVRDTGLDDLYDEYARVRNMSCLRVCSRVFHCRVRWAVTAHVSFPRVCGVRTDPS